MNQREGTYVNPALRRKLARRGHRGLWMGIAAMLVVAAVAVGGFIYFMWLAFAVPKVSGLTRLTHDEFGKRLIGTDSSHLYVKESGLGNGRLPIQGGKITPIARGGGVLDLTFFTANVSPDGSKLLVYQKYGTGPGPMWAEPVGGGPPVRLNGIEGSSGAWSPDGRKLIYVNGKTLYIANADGSNSRKLADLPGRLPGQGEAWTPPVWSPDGKEIALNLVAPQNGTIQIWEISSDGRNLRQMFSSWTPGVSKCCGRWTPDGQYFVFDEQAKLCVARVKVGHFSLFRPPWIVPQPEPLVPEWTATSYLDPVPGKAGKKVYALAIHQGGKLERYDAPSRSFKPFLGGVSAMQVAFSRDGQRAAYITFPTGILWSSKLDGSDKVQLTKPPLFAFAPQWSPDGKEIAFHGLQRGWGSHPRSSRAGSSRIYEVAASGGTPHEFLPKWKGNEADPFWSPDGAWLAFAGTVNGSLLQIRMINIKTHRVVSVQNSQGLFDPRLSPDGRYMLAMPITSTGRGPSDYRVSKLSAGGLRVYDFKTRRVWAPVSGYVGYPCWSHDSRYIYFLSFAQGPAVDRVAVASGKIEQVASLKGVTTVGFDNYWLGLTPDDAPLVVKNAATSEVVSMNWHEP